MNPPSPELSVVLPVYDEAENLKPLHEALVKALDECGKSYEILYADDGSEDGSFEVLKDIAKQNPLVKVIRLRRNFGQTPALNAGIDHARGKIVIFLDADMQNDPADIPKLLKKLDEGYDIVSGWRKPRRDPFLTKVLPSRIANFFISWLTGVKLHDHGCTLKAFRMDVLQDISLYGEMHRFISIIGHWSGAKVGEVVVTHHPRTRGRTKYSLAKTVKVLLDLPVLVLLGTFLTRPIHFFGSIGMISNLIGLVGILKVAYEKFMDPLYKAHRDPILLIAIFFILAGIQVIMIGLLAELITRVYHESLQKKTYVVKELVNLEIENQD